MSLRPTAVFVAAVIITCVALAQNATPGPAAESRLSKVTTGNNEEARSTAGNQNGCHAGCSLSDHPIDPLTKPEYLQEAQQIQNNLRSIQLSRTAGYPMVNSRQNIDWYKAWGETFGRAAMKQIFDEQGVTRVKPFNDVLKSLLHR
jgi:hypothetical protein